MASFTDNADRKWPVQINVTVLKRIKATLDFDLLDALEDEKLFARLYTDPVFLADLLYVICKPAADEQQVTDEQFGQALYGDVLEQATDALVEACADFLSSRRRAILLREAARMRELDRKMLELLDEQIKQVAVHAEAKCRSEVLASGERFMKSLEPSAATPDPSPSAN